MKLVSLILFFLMPLALSAPAKSQVFTPTIAGAMGGAGRAAVDGGESSFLNPASTAHLSEYFFGAHYQRGEHPFEGDYSRWALQLADGTSGNLIRGAASIYRQSIDLPNGLGSRSDQDIQVGIAGMTFPHVALGLSGHYLTQSGQGRDSTQMNGTVGMIFSPSDDMGIGVVAYDIVPSSDATLLDRKLNPTYGAGLQYVFSDLLRLRFDLVRPDMQIYSDRRTNLMAGLESFFANTFVFRLGGQALEASNETNLTAGFGYHGPRLSIDYSFQKDIRSAGGARHLIDLWLPL
jgi:hypothetical protein